MEYFISQNVIGGGRNSKTARWYVTTKFQGNSTRVSCFPLRIFRDRLYAEVRKQTGEAFWVYRRNKKMRKKRVEEEEIDELANATASLNI